MPMELREQLCAVLTEAGRMMVESHDFVVTDKGGHANFVTDIDCKVQAFLMEKLAELYPGSLFIGEEKENDCLTDAPTWVIDPIDGTTNFIHGFKFSCISAALLVNKQVVLGAVCNPYLCEVFSAEKGKGAYCNDRPMHVSEHDFAHALAAFGTSPYLRELAKPTLDTAEAFLASCADLRRSGSAALDLAYVAAGRQDVFFELSLKPWDFAAGSLLVTEAGGCFALPLRGQTDLSAPTAVFASNALCEAPGLAILTEKLAAFGLDQNAVESMTRGT